MDNPDMDNPDLDAAPQFQCPGPCFRAKGRVEDGADPLRIAWV